MNYIAQLLKKRSKFTWIVMGLLLIAVVGSVDYWTGYEISFSLFYLIPVSLLAWFAGIQMGVAASVVSAAAWLLAEITAGQAYSHPGIYFWNSLVRFSFFIIVTFLLTALEKALEREKELSGIDYLTGAVNARLFTEVIQTEINRAQRYKHPFSLAYIDLDNFKTINDTYGHSVGDKVLFAVVHLTRSLLRKNDTIVRLGGDEFAFLLPETDANGAVEVISRIQMSLLGEMEKQGWPVTFSIGTVTFVDTPESSDEAIKMADDLMYAVKNRGKNAINYSIYVNPHLVDPV